LCRYSMEKDATLILSRVAVPIFNELYEVGLYKLKSG
jgi:hypothetical protein